MKEIGINAYRFSISWSRVIPERGKVNEKGVAFYQKLVQELKAAGIEPMITLFHSDMPMWVCERGGWNNEETASDFADFAELMVTSLPDVNWWFTMNEPQCFASDFVSIIAQGSDIKKVTRIILLAHGDAVKRMREKAGRKLNIGFVIMGLAVEPVPGAVSEEEAYQMMTSNRGGSMGMAWWLDPMLLGKAQPALQDTLSEEDLQRIHQPLDMFCANLYGSANFHQTNGRNNPLTYPGMPKSLIKMPIRPACLYWFAKMMYRRYGLPILYTENGFSNIDFVMRDGKVHDPQRIDYMANYLEWLRKATAEGIPVLGYMYWSLTDNFEWKEGYDMRFGLIYIDYITQKRTLKDSAYYYRHVIETNGEDL